MQTFGSAKGKLKSAPPGEETARTRERLKGDKAAHHPGNGGCRKTTIPNTSRAIYEDE